MAERIWLHRTNQSGVGHEETIDGPHLVATIDGTTATIRIHDSDGRLLRVATRTGVNAMDWEPGAERVRQALEKTQREGDTP